jgi:hypothetical protein
MEHLLEVAVMVGCHVAVHVGLALLFPLFVVTLAGVVAAAFVGHLIGHGVLTAIRFLRSSE